MEKLDKEIAERQKKFLENLLVEEPFIYKIKVFSLSSNELLTHYVAGYDIESVLKKVDTENYWIKSVKEIGIIKIEIN